MGREVGRFYEPFDFDFDVHTLSYFLTYLRTDGKFWGWGWIGLVWFSLLVLPGSTHSPILLLLFFSLYFSVFFSPHLIVMVMFYFTHLFIRSFVGSFV